MNWIRRYTPVFLLLVFSPLVAEFMLGDFSVRQLGLLPVFIPLYGGGALLVRELTRRCGRGWPTMLLLALAYALIEEGFTTQSLFNPNYAGQRLLDYGYISSLGTSLHWALFVLTLHVVWSIGSCIAVAEACAGPRWSSPWLGWLGLSATVVLYVIGCAITTIFTLKTSPFVASATQFIAVGVITAALVAAAFLLFRKAGSRREARAVAPPPGAVGALTFVLSSAFYILFNNEYRFRPAVSFAGLIVVWLAAVFLLRAWSTRAGWSPRHALAAATGALITYGWLSTRRMIMGSTALGVPATALDVIGQCVLVIAVLGVVWLGMRAQAAAESIQPAR